MQTANNYSEHAISSKVCKQYGLSESESVYEINESVYESSAISQP